jgi:tetratricopeptide (TPR) repeat protein
MSVFQSEDRMRLKRMRTEKAIQLAMQSRWEEAANLNREMLELFPNDVDTLNRLGKSLLELGRYPDALDAYQQAHKLDPTSTIAQKNIARLEKLVEEHAPPSAPTAIDPRLFIEESGRTAVTTLVDLGRSEDLAKLTAGDQLKLQVQSSAVKVLGMDDKVIGQLEPKLAQRVVRLIEMGNRYSAAVTSTDEQSVRVILREVHRDPSMGTRPSFPTTMTDMGRAYTRDILRYESDDDDDDDEVETVEADDARGETEAGLDEPLSDVGDVAEER